MTLPVRVADAITRAVGIGGTTTQTDGHGVVSASTVVPEFRSEEILKAATELIDYVALCGLVATCTDDQASVVVVTKWMPVGHVIVSSVRVAPKEMRARDQALEWHDAIRRRFPCALGPTVSLMANVCSLVRLMRGPVMALGSMDTGVYVIAIEDSQEVGLDEIRFIHAIAPLHISSITLRPGVLSVLVRRYDDPSLVIPKWGI